MVELAILDKARKQLPERKARMAILDKAQNQRRDSKAGFARRLPLRRQALPVPWQQQQQQQHKQGVVQNQGRTPDLGNCPHLQ